MPTEEERFMALEEWHNRARPFPADEERRRVVDDEIMVERMQQLLEKLERMESAPLLWEGDQA